MTGVGLEPTTCGLKGHELAPASASERQFRRVFGPRTLTSAGGRCHHDCHRDGCLLVLLQQRLEARVVAEGE
jgi:hypothetical protein